MPKETLICGACYRIPDSKQSPIIIVFLVHVFAEIIVHMTESVMNGDAKSIPLHRDKLSWRVSFVTLGRITVTLPLGALFVCFISAIIFKFDEVNQTVCEVCFSLFCNF